MKYTIKKTVEYDGVWFRAYDESDQYVNHTVAASREDCEFSLRKVLEVKPAPIIVAEVEL